MKLGKKARKGCAVMLAAIWLSWGASAAVTGLELSQTEIQLDPGETMELTVRALPEGSALPQLVFTSSDEQVAAVLPSGTVQGVDGGEAVITVSTRDGRFSARCAVSVSGKESSQYSWLILAVEGLLFFGGTGAFALSYRRFIRDKTRREMEGRRKQA